MFTPDQFNSLINELMGQFGGPGDAAAGKSGCRKDGGGNKKNTLAPAELLVIAGILGGVLEVATILIDRDQAVQIRLDGSLRRKTDLDRAMDKIGGYSFDEVLKVLLGRV